MKKQRPVWSDLSTKGKIRYIWDYYKLPIFIAIVLVYILGYFIYGKITHRDMILYTAAVNVGDTDELQVYLKDDFLKKEKINTKKEDMTLYHGLYLTTDTESEYYGYSYASEMKIIGALEAKQLDVVIMDREAFDAFCANGYLEDLDKFLPKYDSKLYSEHKNDLVSNTIILSDNADEVSRNKDIAYEAETKEATLGLSLTDSSFAGKFGIKDDVFVGVIKDSTRQSCICDYIRYLY